MKLETLIKTSESYNNLNRKIYCVKVGPMNLDEFYEVYDWCVDTFGPQGHWYEDMTGLHFYREEDFVLFVLRWS